MKVDKRCFKAFITSVRNVERKTNNLQSTKEERKSEKEEGIESVEEQQHKRSYVTPFIFRRSKKSRKRSEGK